MKWCKLAFRVSFHKVDEHKGETAAIAVHARGTNPYGPEYAPARVGNATAEHDIYDNDALCDYPQSGERIPARSKLQALRSHHHQHGQRVDPVGDPDRLRVILMTRPYCSVFPKASANPRPRPGGACAAPKHSSPPPYRQDTHSTK
jgi:hypothetical protein